MQGSDKNSIFVIIIFKFKYSIKKTINISKKKNFIINIILIIDIYQFSFWFNSSICQVQ